MSNREVQLPPGWLARDVQRASEKVTEWAHREIMRMGSTLITILTGESRNVAATRRTCSDLQARSGWSGNANTGFAAMTNTAGELSEREIASLISFYTGMTNGCVDKAARAIIDRLRSTRPAPAQESAIRKALEWQPISSAPKDGRFLLLHVPEGLESGTVTVGAYFKPEPNDREENGRFKRGNWDGWLGMDVDVRSSWCDPTHWMPLPEPPLGQKFEGQLGGVF